MHTTEQTESDKISPNELQSVLEKAQQLIRNYFENLDTLQRIKQESESQMFRLGES